MLKNLIHQSRITEVNAVSKRIMGAYKKTGLNSKPQMVNLFSSLETQMNSLTEAIKRTKTESLLANKDEIRDNSVRALNYLIVGFTHHPDAEIREAALKVKTIIDKYGLSITYENYASESSLISSLLNDLQLAYIQDAIAMLSGCAETIDNLQWAQDDFENTRIVYEEDKAKEETFENASKIKSELVKYINKYIVTYLDVMQQIDNATYGDFARTVSTIIEDNNLVVKKRKAKEFADDM